VGKLTLALSVVAVALGGTALVLQLTERGVSERVFFTHNASHDTPSVAVYQGFPVGGGWEVQGHETDPEDDRRFPWTLEAIAVCLRD
jgi:hypothetical protein